MDFNYIYDEDIRIQVENFYNNLWALRDRPYNYCTNFLNPSELKYFVQLMTHFPELDYLHTGGHEDPEREVLIVGPYIDPDYFPIDDYLNIIEIKNLPKDITHRDLLGAFLNAGVERFALGDILIKEDLAHIMVLKSVTDFLVAHINKIKRYPVKLQVLDEIFVTSPEKEFKEQVVTVSSLRLDTIISGICNLSRKKTNDLISRKFVKINHELEDRKNSYVQLGDLISVRGYGRFILDENLGTTRKKNSRIRVLKYI